MLFERLPLVLQRLERFKGIIHFGLGSADINLGAAYIVSGDGEVIYSEQTNLKIFGRQAKSITIEGELPPETYSVKVVASDGSASGYTFKVE